MAPQVRDLLERLLEQQNINLTVWLQAQRAEGLSYNRIAAELHRLTGGVSTVTGQTIGLWLADSQAVAS